MQISGSLRVDFLHVEEALGVVVAKFVAQLVAALWNRTDAAPFAVADLEDLVDQVLRDLVALALTTRGYWFSTSARAGFELAHGHQAFLPEYPSARIR